jgi:hypothetical protein
VRIVLWIFAGLLGGLLVLAAFPWLTLKDFRDSSRGRDFLHIMLVCVVLLAFVLYRLLGRPA